MFTWDFISGEMTFFQFGIPLISYNCLHENPRNEAHCAAGVIFLRSLWRKLYFISSDKMLCKHYPQNEIIRKETAAENVLFKIAVVTFELQSKVLCIKETEFIRVSNWNQECSETNNMKIYILDKNSQKILMKKCSWLTEVPSNLKKS